MSATCAVHAGAASIGTCARCGAFACAACFDASTGWCAACRARSDLRLEVPGRARAALWLAVAGTCGVLPLLPIAVVLGVVESRTRNPVTRPFAQGAMTLAAVATIAWAAAFWTTLQG